MSDIVLSIFCASTLWTSKTPWSNDNCSHFTDEEIEDHKVTSIAKVTQLAQNNSRTWTPKLVWRITPLSFPTLLLTLSVTNFMTCFSMYAFDAHGCPFSLYTQSYSLLLKIIFWFYFELGFFLNRALQADVMKFRDTKEHMSILPSLSSLNNAWGLKVICIFVLSRLFSCFAVELLFFPLLIYIEAFNILRELVLCLWYKLPTIFPVCLLCFEYAFFFSHGETLCQSNLSILNFMAEICHS